MSVVVEVLNVKDKEACIARGQDTIDHDIRCGQTSTVGDGFPGKIEFVTTNCAPDAMDFGLVGAKRRNKSGVGHNTSFWDVGIGPEE